MNMSGVEYAFSGAGLKTVYLLIRLSPFLTDAMLPPLCWREIFPAADPSFRADSENLKVLSTLQAVAASLRNGLLR